MKLIVALLLTACAVAAFGQNTNRSGTILASAARTATTNGQDMSNDAYQGVHVILDITAVPGGDSVTLTVQGKDPASGKYYSVLVGSAETTTGTKVYKVYPGIATLANGAANDILPTTWRVIVTHSAGTSFTYSVGYHYIF